MLQISLFSVLLLVLSLPVLVHKIEKNLEFFLLIMGALAVSCAHWWGTAPAWSLQLVRQSLAEPLMITGAVLISGFALHYVRDILTPKIIAAEKQLGPRLFSFCLVTALGLISSVVTAIMAAIILVEVVSALRFDKEYEKKLVVLACYAIGLGAVLTPIGEPLSTICISKLAVEPYRAGFFFLFRTLGCYVVPGIAGLGAVSACIKPPGKITENECLFEKEKPRIKDIFGYAVRIYVFIVALVYLGAGFKPIIDTYIIKLSSVALYWINMISAVLDNATLSAAEISPLMSILQIKYILMGLLISGGMLIPGNVPNIISASRLGITSKEWAKIAIPPGLVLMLIYFAVFSLHLT